MTCCICHGPAHPASGAQYSDRALACWSCVMESWTWLRRRMKGKPRGGGPNFYDHIKKPCRLFHDDIPLEADDCPECGEPAWLHPDRCEFDPLSHGDYCDCCGRHRDEHGKAG